MDRKIPFRIGSDMLPGISKYFEESHEVGQVLAKAMGLGSLGTHWDGTELKPRLESELGDQLAALTFLVHINDLDMTVIEAQAEKKLERFELWHDNIQNGRDPNHGVVYDDDEHKPVDGEAR